MAVDLDSSYDTQREELRKVFYPDAADDAVDSDIPAEREIEDVPELIFKRLNELLVVKEHGLPQMHILNGCLDVVIPRTYTPWDAVRTERILRAACTEAGLKLFENRILYYYRRRDPHVIRSDMKQRVTYVDCLDRAGNLTSDAMDLFQQENEGRRCAKVGSRVRNYFWSIDKTLYIVITRTYKYDVQSESFAGW